LADSFAHELVKAMNAAGVRDRMRFIPGAAEHGFIVPLRRE
jgi:hypothetical protein